MKTRQTDKNPSNNLKINIPVSLIDRAPVKDESAGWGANQRAAKKKVNQERSHRWFNTFPLLNAPPLQLVQGDSELLFVISFPPSSISPS